MIDVPHVTPVPPARRQALIDQLAREGSPVERATLTVDKAIEATTAAMEALHGVTGHLPIGQALTASTLAFQLVTADCEMQLSAYRAVFAVLGGKEGSVTA